MIILSENFKEKETLKYVTSHKKAIDSALEKAKKLGQGSSRVVFELQDPEYGETVIKIAKNKKGLEQNDYELGILIDGIHSDILPKLYDYDKDSIMLKKNDKQPLWLQVEKVNKITRKQFEDKIGVSEHDLSMYLLYNADNYKFRKLYHTLNISLENKEKLDNDEFIQEVLGLAGNYDVATGDLATYRNFGIKNDSLVLIDVGASNDIIKKYYQRKGFENW